MIELLTSTEVLVGLFLAVGGAAVTFLGSTFFAGAKSKAEQSLTSDLRGDMQDGFRDIGNRLDGFSNDIKAIRSDSLATREQGLLTQVMVENLRKETREDISGIKSDVNHLKDRVSLLEDK